MAIKPPGGAIDAGRAGGIGGPGIIRPMYGVFIRDQVEQYRNMLGATLTDLKAGIKAGKQNKHAVAHDGVLEGSELTKAKKAALKVDQAIKELKPVFGEGFGAIDTNAGRAALGRPGGGMVAMYGVILADDLNKYRTGINADIAAIKTAVDKGELKGPALKEAKQALRDLKSAATALGTISGW
jgi:hypothetical protein